METADAHLDAPAGTTFQVKLGPGKMDATKTASLKTVSLTMEDAMTIS
jgi:hypothetical protein